MKTRSIPRLFLAGLTLLVAYVIIVVLFVITAVFGPMMFLLLPFLLAVPPLISSTEAAVRSLSGRRFKRTVRSRKDASAVGGLNARPALRRA